MLCNNRIDASDGIDVNKTSILKKSDICLYWYFLGKRFKFQPDVSNGCHDVLMMSMSLSNITILNNRGADYHYIFIGISKCKVINLMYNIDLTKNIVET